MHKKKILKYNYVNVDQNKVQIEPPVFDFTHSLDDFENSITDDGFGYDSDGDAYESTEELLSEATLTPNDIMEVAKLQAEEIIRNAEIKAEERAREITNEARRESEREAREAYERARKNGFDEGYEKAVDETEDMKREAKALLESARLEKETVLDGLEEQLVDLSVSIIEKILNDTKAINPQIVLNLIRKGLSETKMTGDIFVHVSQTEYDEVLEHKGEIPELGDPNVNIEIIKDYALKSGDCILETSFGNIDCSIDEQFKNLRKSLYLIADNKKQ